jgi:hypothetical protein
MSKRALTARLRCTGPEDERATRLACCGSVARMRANALRALRWATDSRRQLSYPKARRKAGLRVSWAPGAGLEPAP